MTIWTLITSNTNAASGDDLLVNASNQAIYITLPTSPVAGDQVQLADGSANTSYLVSVSAGSSTIEGSGNTLALTQNGYQISLIYNGSLWKRYNLALPQVKVSELSEILSPSVSNNDLMLFVDAETQESNKIKLSTLKGNFNAGLYSNTNVTALINDLNAYTTANTLPRLNTRSFDGRLSSFYLNYTNLTNKPTIPTKTSQLTNDGNVANGAPYITGLSTFTTDQLAEGINNFYFTDTRFDARLDARFPELYRLYSNEFEEAQVIDSEVAISAEPTTVFTATNAIQVSLSDITKFAVGQQYRIFGANVENTPITATPTIVGTTKSGLTGSSGNTVAYKLAQFDTTTGKISPASATSTTILIGTNTLDSFNNTNNIELTFNKSSGNYGILVYRSYNGGAYSLIDVLGPKDLGPSTTTNIKYKDFGNFNNNPWTRKNANGEYVAGTGIIHMPLTAPNSASKGWVDAVVSSVQDTVDPPKVIFTSSYNMSSQVTLCQNDTAAIQAAINERISAGVNSLVLNDRRYVVSAVELPSTGKFTLSGKGRQTTLYKLPWSTESHNRMIYAPGVTAENVSITNMNIDGNMQNQWLKYDSGNDSDANYTVSLMGTGINLDKLFVNNIIGGGLFSFQPSTLTINLCRFENSGMSDYHAFSPLYAPEGDDLIITNNVFRNFSDSIDLNTTDNGVFAGNFVENTGSGVLVFGSRFFISSPNILKGPAGEFIPTPDVFNSEYDSVNITLEANTTFTSPMFTYQENGQTFDLLANSGSLTYKIDKLGKFDNQEVLYGTLPNNLIADQVGPDKSQGQFRFNITKANVETLMTTYSYPTLKAANTAHVGLVYRAIQTEIVPSATVIGAGEANTGGIGSDKYRVTVENYSNLSVGRTVLFENHGGDIGAGTLNNTEGVIFSVSENTGSNPPQAFVTIDYSAAVTSPGSGGTLRVKNEFILVKGRIQ
jgi:hypothetical protein